MSASIVRKLAQSQSSFSKRYTTVVGRDINKKHMMEDFYDGKEALYGL
jgi:hypothetical protein